MGFCGGFRGALFAASLVVGFLLMAAPRAMAGVCLTTQSEGSEGVYSGYGQEGSYRSQFHFVNVERGEVEGEVSVVGSYDGGTAKLEAKGIRTNDNCLAGFYVRPLEAPTGGFEGTIGGVRVSDLEAKIDGYLSGGQVFEEWTGGGVVNYQATLYNDTPSQGEDFGQVRLTPPSGGAVVTNLVASAAPPGIPPGLGAPVGAVSYTLNNVTPRGTVQVRLVLPAGSTPTGVYKLHEGVYYAYPASKTVINGNTIYVEIEDNGPWDENPTLGEITDPIVPVSEDVKVGNVTPDAGLEAGGAAVTITGSGFTGAETIKFGSTEATRFTVNSESSITATAPPGTGTVDVTVSTSNSTSTATSEGQFSYVPAAPAPTIKKLSAKKGPAEGETPVTITGANFTGVTAVKFGSTEAAKSEVTSPTSMTVTSPPSTSGTVNLTVTTANSTNVLSSKDHFKYENPTVIGVSPQNGVQAGGTPITITGTGFALGTGTTFAFGKALGTEIDCTSTTTCNVVAPAATKAETVDVRAAVGKAKSKKQPPYDEYTYN